MFSMIFNYFFCILAKEVCFEYYSITIELELIVLETGKNYKTQ
jgi:hypothetical protein